MSNNEVFSAIVKISSFAKASINLVTEYLLLSILYLSAKLLNLFSISILNPTKANSSFCSAISIKENVSEFDVVISFISVFSSLLIRPAFLASSSNFLKS